MADGSAAGEQLWLGEDHVLSPLPLLRLCFLHRCVCSVSFSALDPWPAECGEQSREADLIVLKESVFVVFILCAVSP